MNWPVMQSVRMLEILTPGHLLPWIGPALRGLVARPFKNAVCIHAPDVRDREWIYCRGCPSMHGCAYGETFEPDPPAESNGENKAAYFKGQSDAPRPIVLTPLFPCPSQVERGMWIPLQITFIGETAIRHVEEVWRRFNEAGQQHDGLGNDHVAFRVTPLPTDHSDSTAVIDLPQEPVENDDEIIVGVELTTPLCLNTEEKPTTSPVVQTRGGNRPRYLATQPTFLDLFRAAQRTIGGLHALLFGRRMEATFDILKAAAENVATVRSRFEYFEQGRRSKRSGSRLVRGTFGYAEYGPMPKFLLPWIEWGGRLHVGTDRVAGAGGWKVSVRSA